MMGIAPFSLCIEDSIKLLEDARAARIGPETKARGNMISMKRRAALKYFHEPRRNLIPNKPMKEPTA